MGEIGPSERDAARSKSPEPKGRGSDVTWDGSKYVKLLIWRPDQGPDRWLIALRTTADYYGWTKEFELWSPKAAMVTEGYTYFRDPGRLGEMFC